jgi:predicted nucleic acid-binding protein
VTVYVLDASVAAKWYLPAEGETNKETALALLRDYSSGTIELVVPDVFWTECGNIFWKAARQGRISARTAEDSIADLVTFDLVTVGSKALLREALRIASEFDRSVYDAAYVALASEWHAPLVTADERLANALAARFPIRWLGAYAGPQ